MDSFDVAGSAPSGTTRTIEATDASGDTGISPPLALGAGTLKALNGASLRINSTAPINLGASTRWIDAGTGSSIRLWGNISGTMNFGRIPE